MRLTRRATRRASTTPSSGVFGVQRRSVARYEAHVAKLDNRSGFIDLFWPGVLIVEQKSAGRDLRKAYEQAGEYFDALPERERPRFILVSDFQSFELHDLDEREAVASRSRICPRMSRRSVSSSACSAGPSAIRIRRTSKPPSWSGGCTTRSPMPDTVGTIWNASSCASCSACSPTTPGYSSRATSSSTSSRHAPARTGADLGPWLAQLFEVLDTPEDERAATLDEDLARFPYVNGDLFKGTPADILVRHGDAWGAARCLSLRLVEHLARDLRCAVPVGDGPGGTPRPGRALHDREEHPQGDRAPCSWTTSAPSSSD